MPPRNDFPRRTIAADIPYIQFTRSRLLPSQDHRTSWPSAHRLRQLPQLKSVDSFPTSKSKTGLGVPTRIQDTHDCSHNKSKPFSFALQPRKEFPWSSARFIDEHVHLTRSYEKQDKRSYRLPVDPVSRLVWDDEAAPQVNIGTNFTKVKHGDTPDISIGELTRSAQWKAVPTSDIGALLPPAKKQSQGSLPYALLKKYAKTNYNSKKSGLHEDMAKSPKTEKSRDSGYGSSLNTSRNSKMTLNLPELKDIHNQNKNTYISHYHANCYDSDDDLDASWTLPRIETVLKSEGVEPGSITHQIEKIRTRKSRDYDNERRLKWKQVINKRKLGQAKLTDEEKLPSLTDDPESSKAKEEIEQYFKDIEKIRWMSQRQIESGLVANDVPVPRVVLISSQIPGASGLLEIIKDNTILPIMYDYNDETLNGILKGIRLRLDDYKKDYSMRSILLYCQGGPGYLYILKKKVVTRQKLENIKNKDMAKFINNLGCMISKLDTKQAYVHLVGTAFDSDDANRKQFMEILEEKTKPSIAHFESVDVVADEGKDILGLYFKMDGFEKWKYHSERKPES